MKRISNSAQPDATARQGARLAAITTLYGVVGLSFATWVTQTPAVRDALGLTTAEMGSLLLTFAGGSVLGLVGAGRFIKKFGARAAVVLGVSLVGIGLASTAVGTAWGSLPAVIAALLVFGFGNGLGDVGLNVEASALEREVQRSVLPTLHAGYSAGNLLGAGVGAGGVFLGVTAPFLMGGIAAMALTSILIGRTFMPRGTSETNPDDHPDSPAAAAATPIWKDGRLLCLGIVVLGMGFAEGSGHDWLPLLMVDGYGAEHGSAAIMYGIFVTAMLVVRILGGFLVDRFGRVAVLRTTAICAIVGLVLVISDINMVIAAAGVLLWGIGAALGFPLGISAAGDSGQGAASRVSFVTVVGYGAFLAGPPLLGYLSHEVGILWAMTAVLAGLCAVMFVLPAAREVKSAAPSC